MPPNTKLTCEVRSADMASGWTTYYVSLPSRLWPWLWRLNMFMNTIWRP